MGNQPGSSHYMPITDIIRRAWKRLEEIKQDDIDELLSLVIAKKARIWGIKRGVVLYILWWDPKHEICPSYKKNT